MGNGKLINMNIVIRRWGRRMMNSSAGFTISTDARKLSRLSHFEFKKHERYNVSEERLKFLNTFIRNRALELIEVIQKGIKPKKKTLSALK